MAKIIRIVSADGKKVISKILPAVPTHFKIPPGAQIEVIDKDTGKRESIGRYVNTNAPEEGRSRDEDEGTAQPARITIEYVDGWEQAQQWLDHMAGPAAADLASADWFHIRDTSGDGEVLGFDQTPLLIGGLVGAAAVAGVAAAGGGSSRPRDTIAPVAPSVLDLATEDDTGNSSTDNATNLTSGLTFTGTAEAGSSIEIFDGNTSVGTTTASAAGTFTIDLDLAIGIHVLTARATDAAGNVSAPSASLQIAIDQNPPTAATNLDLAAADDSGVSSSDNITNIGTGLTITGNTDPAATVELFSGTTSLGTALANGAGLFTLDVTLAEGVHSITAVARDLVGNRAAASEALVITVDRTLPAIPTGLDLSPADDDGVSSSDNITSVTSGLTITGSAEAGTLVQLFAGTAVVASVTAGSNGLFTADIALDPGSHDITARATDLAGNFGPSSALLALTIVGAGGEIA